MTHDIPEEEMTARELAQYRRDNPGTEPEPAEPAEGDLEPKPPVDEVVEVNDDELDHLEQEGAADVEFLPEETATENMTVDNSETEDEPASDEVRAEATGDEPPPKKAKPRRR